jgi:urea transporter
LAGLLFCAASFLTDPFVGLVGLTAVVAANLTALRVWHDRIRWEFGLAGYNAVLLGLAVGHYLPHTRLAFLLAVAGGPVSAVATEWLNHRFSRKGLPVLALPFLALAWLVIAFAGSGHSAPHLLRADPLARYLPGFVSSTLQVFGSAFLSRGVLSGAVVLAGLLVVSRISAGAAMAGAVVAALTTLSRPMPEVSINLVIVPIGLVFFLAPGRKMLWQLPTGILLTGLLCLGFDFVSQGIHMPFLILPLTATLFAALLLGRSRAAGVELVPMAMLRSPEAHFRAYLGRKRPELHLPFFGTWYVSQGVDGGETHRGRLAHAWDFLVRDERGRSFVTPGYRLADYHAFGLLVCAPAAGRVAAVDNSVPDNAPGRLNRDQNWGNYVVIEHSFLEYSILAHLQQGSIRVKAGDMVGAGAVIGTCGNSGYSGQPHLHYQLQSSPIPGSDALACEFHDYLAVGAGREEFFRRGIPAQGETVQPLVPQENVRRLLTSGLDVPIRFRVAGLGSRAVEVWNPLRRGETVSLSGNGARVSLEQQLLGIAVKSAQGRGSSLLCRAFKGLEFLPFHARPGLEFRFGAWRHAFGSREQLAGGVDTLLLESVSKGVERRIWFAEGTGIVRIEWIAGARQLVAERE